VFCKEFELDDTMMQQLIAEGEKEGVKFDEEEYKKSESLIKLQLKALIARDLWNMNEYYHTINVVNESVNKALELLK
jgi:carboxyl-terminal processing protease